MSTWWRNCDLSMKAHEFGREIFLNRELGWLQFNDRVLDEAGCKANPLLERLKFIAICAGNLDEFFMVRMAGLRQLVKIKRETADFTGLTPHEQIVRARSHIERMLKRQYRYLGREILPALEKHGIRLRHPGDLSEASRRMLKKFFDTQVFPILTPIAVDPSHPFPILRNGAIEIAVSMKSATSPDTVYAFVEVPEVLPRFIPADDDAACHTYVLLEELIMDNLPKLFTNCDIGEFFPFRIIRDMDFAIDETGVSDLLHSIEKNLLERRSREPIQLQMPAGVRGKLAAWLQNQFDLAPEFRYTVGQPLHLQQFMALVERESANRNLVEPDWPPLKVPGIDNDLPVIESIKENGPFCIMLPFHSFDPVVRLINEAAEDPAVLAIKQTLYRVSGNSPIVRALQRAAENGKQVTVIVELKARFDEGNNIIWAQRLEESGAHVVYGISGLKIHCKALLIIRRESGVVRRYVHLSTGNYNDKTAMLYTDIGMMSCDSKLCEDVSALFNIVTGYSSPMSNWHKVALAPFDLREKFLALIDREIRLSTPENPGHIIAKMNALVDGEVIRHLYEAAHAGVKIDLIVRGICCLRPGYRTDNIRVISIVDRFLEHSRIFRFKNGGNPEYYLSSADWMPRNLNARIELLFPVDDEASRQLLDEILTIQLEDREKARVLRSDGQYVRKFFSRHTPARSQWRTYQMLSEHNAPEAFADCTRKLTVHTGVDSCLKPLES